MEWTNIAEQIGLDPDQTPVYVFQRSMSEDGANKINFDYTRELADQPLTKETLNGLGIPLELADSPVAMVTTSTDHVGDRIGPLRDIYFAISHGPAGSGMPITVMHCQHRPPWV